MEACTLLPEGFSVVGSGNLMGVLCYRSGFGCRKGGIPSHGFWESPFRGYLRQTGVDNWFKMYANGCYWAADRR